MASSGWSPGGAHFARSKAASRARAPHAPQDDRRDSAPGHPDRKWPGDAIVRCGYYLLVIKTSATAAATTASRAIRRAVGAQPARAVRPISLINRPRGSPP
jgi:hypothetical protein